MIALFESPIFYLCNVGLSNGRPTGTVLYLFVNPTFFSNPRHLDPLGDASDGVVITNVEFDGDDALTLEGVGGIDQDVPAVVQVISSESALGNS